MTDTAPYDLDKIHPDKLRLSKRKKLFKRSFAFTIIGLLIAFKLTSPTAFTAMAISAYNVKDSQKALRYLAPLFLSDFSMLGTIGTGRLIALRE